jgi:hypothetical protein
VPLTGGKTLLNFLAEKGRLDWLSPEIAASKLVTKPAQGEYRSALDTSVAMHPDKIPSHLVTSEYLLAPEAVVESYDRKSGVRTMSGKSRLGAIYDQETLDKLAVRPEFAKQAEVMKDEIVRKVRHDESELAKGVEDRKLPPLTFGSEGPDDRYIRQIGMGKRWLARMETMFPTPAKPARAPVMETLKMVPDVDPNQELWDAPTVYDPLPGQKLVTAALPEKTAARVPLVTRAPMEVPHVRKLSSAEEMGVTPPTRAQNL